MIVLFMGPGGGLVVPTGELMPFGAQDLVGQPEWLYPGIMPSTQPISPLLPFGLAAAMPRAGTLRRIGARHNTPGLPDPPRVVRYEVYVDGVATGLFVDLAPDAVQVIGPALALALPLGAAVAVLAYYPFGGLEVAPSNVVVTLDIA